MDQDSTHPFSFNKMPRNRDQAGANETKDIEAIVRAIHTRTPAGIKICEAFLLKFGLELLDARARPGNRGIHYDFQILVGPAPGLWKTVEHKGSQLYKPIPLSQTPWAAGVQFHNGGCEKYSLAKKYARAWYDFFIGSGKLKADWKLEAPTPSYEEWYAKDAKCQDDPGTEFGCELKRVVRLARGPKGSLLKERSSVNDTFEITEEDLATLKAEVLSILNSVLNEKDFWLTIQGDVTGDFYCAWYPKFTLREIESVTVDKRKDFWFDYKCEGFAFKSILRFGKGAGFSNLRMDAR